jgi:uncharacterized tellurite resistance protein B-like protein
MPNWQEIKERVAARGRVEDYEVEKLRQVLYADGKINRQEADALAELHKLVKHRTPAFEQFFTQAVRDYVLEDGRISALANAAASPLLRFIRRIATSDSRGSELDQQLLNRFAYEGDEAAFQAARDAARSRDRTVSMPLSCSSTTA